MKRINVLTILLMSSIIVSLVSPSIAGAHLINNPDNTFYIANGPVKAMAVSTDDTSIMYIGGSFNYVGPKAGSGVLLDETTGLFSTDFPMVTNGTVNTVVRDTSGGWYIGGSFTRVGEYSRYHLAHILSDGSVDANWNPGTDGIIRVLKLNGSTLYVGGSFSSIGGQSRNRIAALDASTGLATSWNPNASNDVLDLEISGSYIYAGGFFSSIGGQSRNRIAALDASTGLATSWNPNANNDVLDLEISGSYIYVGGLFSSIGGQSRNRIAALDASTGLATSWNPNAGSGVVKDIVISDSIIYIGGQFSEVSGQSRSNLAAFSLADGLITHLNIEVNSTVNTLVIRDSNLYMGGSFTSVDNQPRNHLASLDISSGVINSWNPSIGDEVYTVSASDSGIYVGGNFSSVNGESRNNLAAISLTTGRLTDWQFDTNGTVDAIKISSGIMYIGGEFSLVNNQERNHLAAINIVSGELSESTDLPSVDGPVFALDIFDGALYIGGLFSSVGEETKSNFALIELNHGGAVSPWTIDTDDAVYAIKVHKRQDIPDDGTVYIGGEFSSISQYGETYERKNLASFGAGDSVIMPWAPQFDGGVYSLAVNNNNLYVGGWFTSIDEETHPGAASFSLDGHPFNNALNSWNPNLEGGVYAFAFRGSDVYIGGEFWGENRTNLAIADEITGEVTETSPQMSDVVIALFSDNNKLYAGGNFELVNDNLYKGFAAFYFSPTSPSNLSTNNITTNSVDLSWQDNSDNEDGFIIERSINGTDYEEIKTVDSNTTLTTISSLSPSTKYWFRVASTIQGSFVGYGTLSEGVYTLNRPSSNSSGSSSSPSLRSITCNQVIYSDWQASCIGGFQYRSYSSVAPFNCSLTQEQINNAKRPCSTVGNTSNSQTNTGNTNTPVNNSTNSSGKTSTIKFLFRKNLKLGNTNADVKQLQIYLNNNGFMVAKSGPGSKGRETNIFGPATKNALIKFQLKHKIKPASGYFGPLTRTFINKQ